MIKIKIKISVKQTSSDTKYETVDYHAEMIQMDESFRIVYQEESKGRVTLDVGHHYVLLRRDDAWITHATFQKNQETLLRIISTEGELQFKIQLLALETTLDSLYIKYQLFNDQGMVDSHEYQCNWTKGE